MKLTCYGGVGQVTGANYLLESQGAKILIDCGLHQGGRFCEKLNFEKFAYQPRDIAAVFITHAHIDHTGKLPKLFRDGFRGTIYSTPPTRDFAELLLLDSEHLLIESATHLKKPPIYSTDDIHATLAAWKGIPYYETIVVGPFRVTLRNAGHILGSSSILIEADGKQIIFSGDLGNMPAPIIGATDEIPLVDAAVIESTYGDRLHEGSDRRKEALEDMIEDVVKSGGVLMIPAFAMERTQELLFELNDLVDSGRIPRVPVFIDSPLAIKLTTVYQRYPEYFSKETRELIDGGDFIFHFPGLRSTLTTEESKSINDVPPPKVIIAGSGMSNGGRILHHEQRYLSDPKSAIVFIGYQAVGTLGRTILEGAKTVKIFNEEIPVRCHVQSIPGYSAHADQDQLLHWLAPARGVAKNIYVVQGEPQSSEALAQKIRDELALTTTLPELGKSYDII